MSGKNYQQGSLWRKWDLHLHSPSSVLNNQFEGSSPEEKWNNYISALEQVPDVSVLGITDYFSVDGYQKLLLAQGSGRLRTVDLLLPNVELRLDLSTREGRPVNLHVLFNPSIVQDLENRFFSRLKFEFQQVAYSAARRDLIALGKACLNDQNASEEASYKKGVEQFKVSHTDLFRLIDADALIRNNAFVIVADKSGDGASGLRDDSLRALREELYRKVDALFSSTPATCEYFVGAGTDPVEEVVRKFGSLKPCLHGSDAHDAASICRPTNNRFTWIKADPTFEGLRQVVFEPRDRVRIQENNPQYENKRPFFSRIRIGSGPVFSGSHLNYTNCDLEINPNLVCIIGGRGSGKSVLLGSLKKTFFKKQSNNPDDKSDQITTSDYHVTFTKVDNTAEEYHIQEANNLEYLHVSQGEVKTIVQNPELLDQQIKALLGIIEPGSSLFKSSEIKPLIGRVLEIKSYFNEKDQDGKIIHEKSYQELQKKKYRDLIATITTDSNKEMIGRYQDNSKKVLELTTLKADITGLLSEFTSTHINFSKKIKLINQRLANEESRVPEIDFSLQETKLRNALRVTDAEISRLQGENTKIIEDFRRAGIEGDLTTLLEKVEQYQIQIQGHDDKLRKIEEFNQEISDCMQTLSRHSREIQSRLQNYVSQLQTRWHQIRSGKDGWSTEQKRLAETLTRDIEIRGEIKFDVDAFYRIVGEALNRSKFRATKDESIEQRIKSFFGVTDSVSYFSVLEDQEVFDIGERRVNLLNVLDVDAFVKDGEKSLLNALFDPEIVSKYLKVLCQLRYKTKSPEQLSVGQRGTFFVCLKLATDTFGLPFVFDQPEDDLDNAFIMTQLVPLFREIKKYRQVIVVTHNANLVVNADAEQVVVAENEGEKVKYEAGALENSKSPDQGACGIRENVCDILEGGKNAFRSREQKYRIGI